MSWFPEYTIASAPAGSRRFMAATQNHLGYLPAATARWAASPHLLEGFAKLNAIFENGTLDPVAREVVVMTIATRNGCHVCVAMHTARLTALGARTHRGAGVGGDRGGGVGRRDWRDGRADNRASWTGMRASPGDLRELTAADEEEFIGLARASVGLHLVYGAHHTRRSRHTSPG